MLKRWLGLLVCLYSVAALCQSTVTITSTVKKSKSVVMQYGDNDGTFNNYETGQKWKNLLCNGHNCGNEPFSQIQLWQIQGSPTLSNTQIQSNINNVQYDAVPANFWAGGQIKIIDLTASPGSEEVCTQTISSNTVAATGNPAGAIYTYPSCGLTAVAGRHLFKISKKIPGSPLEYFCGGSGSCSFQTSDLCAACGTQTMEFNATAGSIFAGLISDQTSQNEYVLINGGTWTAEFDAKLKSGSGSFTFFVNRGSTTLCSFSLTPTTSWTHLTSAGCVNPVDTGTGTVQQLQFGFTIPSGMDLLLDNNSFKKTVGIDPTNTTEYRDEVIAAQKDFYQRAGSAAVPPPCRSGAQPAANTIADLIQTSQFNHSPSDSGMHGYDNSNAYVPEGFKQYLDKAILLNCTPYFIFPVTVDRSEAQAFIHWLFTSGYAATFTSAGLSIYIEFGNEDWNIGTFTGFALGFNSSSPCADTIYCDYYRRAGQVFAAMRSQATTDGITNLKYAVGDWTAIPPSDSTTNGYAKADLHLLNGYTQGGNLNDYSTDTLLWTPAMLQPYSMATSSNNADNFFQAVGIITGYTNCGSGGNVACKVGVYAGSITQARLDGFVDGQGYGVISCDQYMGFQDLNVDFQAMFASQQYYFTANGLNAHIFGYYVDAGGATSLLNGRQFTPRPQHTGGKICNMAAIGDKITTSIASNPSCTLASNSNGVNAITAPCIASHAFVNGNKTAILLINRDVTSTHAVTFTGAAAPPNGSTVTQTLYYNSNINAKNEAANLNATNTTAMSVDLATSTLSSFNPSSSFTLQPHSLYLLTFTTGSASTGGKVISGKVRRTGNMR
jgi:hypothetical protein